MSRRNFSSKVTSERARSLGDAASGTFTFGGSGSRGRAGGGDWAGRSPWSTPVTIARRSAAIALNRSPRGRPVASGPPFIQSQSESRLPPLPQPYW